MYDNCLCHRVHFHCLCVREWGDDSVNSVGMSFDTAFHKWLGMVFVMILMSKPVPLRIFGRFDTFFAYLLVRHNEFEYYMLLVDFSTSKVEYICICCKRVARSTNGFHRQEKYLIRSSFSFF